MLWDKVSLGHWADEQAMVRAVANSADKNMPKLINVETKEVLLTNLETADSFWKRLVGLMFRKRVSQGFGIWIKPCKSIHTMWMRMAIDVYFIDDADTVIGVKKAVRPWQIAFAPNNTQSVLETAVGTIDLCISTKIAMS